MTTGIVPTPCRSCTRLQHLPAVDLRHHHVEQDQVGRLLLERREPLLRARRLADRVAVGLEAGPDEAADAGIVVHDQDQRPRAARPGRSG